MTSTTIDAPTPSSQNLDELCSLSPQQLEERKAMVRREISPHVIRRSELANGISFEFTPSSETHAKLQKLAALERQCCQPLDFALREAGGSLHLDILGADPKSGFFDDLSLGRAAGTLEPTATNAGLRRVLRTGGLAALASLLVCCVAPLALVSLTGVAVGGALTLLDNPYAIAAGTALFGVGIWRLEGRRHAKKPATASQGCGC